MLQDSVQFCNFINAHFVQCIFMFSLNKCQPPPLRIFLNEYFSNLNLKAMSRQLYRFFKINSETTVLVNAH